MSEDSLLVELIMFFTMLSVIFEIVSGERSPARARPAPATAAPLRGPAMFTHAVGAAPVHAQERSSQQLSAVEIGHAGALAPDCSTTI